MISPVPVPTKPIDEMSVARSESGQWHLQSDRWLNFGKGFCQPQVLFTFASTATFTSWLCFLFQPYSPFSSVFELNWWYWGCDCCFFHLFQPRSLFSSVPLLNWFPFSSFILTSSIPWNLCLFKTIQFSSCHENFWKIVVSSALFIQIQAPIFKLTLQKAESLRITCPKLHWSFLLATESLILSDLLRLLNISSLIFA